MAEYHCIAPVLVAYCVRTPKPLRPVGTTERVVGATAALLTGQQSNDGFACEGSGNRGNKEAATELWGNRAAATEQLCCPGCRPTVCIQNGGAAHG